MKQKSSQTHPKPLWRRARKHAGVSGNHRSALLAAEPCSGAPVEAEPGEVRGNSAAEGPRGFPPAAAVPLPKAEPAKPVIWQQFAYLWYLLPFFVIALQAGKVAEKYGTLA